MDQYRKRANKCASYHHQHLSWFIPTGIPYYIHPSITSHPHYDDANQYHFIIPNILLSEPSFEITSAATSYQPS